MTTTPFHQTARPDSSAPAENDAAGAIRPSLQVLNRITEYEVPVDPAELTRCDACE
jgi:hypothetical protein